jgi:thymidylate synthase/dihydrofolate reductase
MHPRLTLVFATNSDGLFGKNNTIPWTCPEDMRHFNRITTDTFHEPLLLMGRKTFESLPKKLAGRKHIVLSSSPVPAAEYTVSSIEAFLDYPGFQDKHVFVIGGVSLIETLYNKYENLIDSVYYTRVNHSGGITADDTAVYMSSTLLEDLQAHAPTESNIQGCASFYKYTFPKHAEYQYLQLLDDCLKHGNVRQTRNAITHSMFNKTISFDLAGGAFPLLTTKKVFMRGIFEELLFFLKGQTDSKLLEAKGVNIWRPNTTAEFLAACKLPYKEGTMGPMYGWNWRHFGASYVDAETDYAGSGFDQLDYVMKLLKSDPHSRRILMTTYNPATARDGVLYPCHSIVIQFYVTERDSTYYVSMSMYQRSVDLACGLPFNIASNALLLHMICDCLNSQGFGKTYVADKMHIVLGDIHIYQQHVDGIKEQLRRIPKTFPTLHFKQSQSVLTDYVWDDVEVCGYESHPAIKYDMVA